MYAIHSTEGFVLKSIAKGEADRFYTVLTRDFGLIRAEGQGVRKIDSKLRHALQDFSLIKLSIVRGREKWRITNVSFERNIFTDLHDNIHAIQLVARIFALIARLLSGEEKNEQLFEHLKNGLVFLADNRPTGQFLQNAEYLLVLRILHTLGYLGAAPDWSIFTSSSIFETGILLRIGELKRKAIVTINESLRESHL